MIDKGSIILLTCFETDWGPLCLFTCFATNWRFILFISVFVIDSGPISLFTCFVTGWGPISFFIRFETYWGPISLFTCFETDWGLLGEEANHTADLPGLLYCYHPDTTLSSTHDSSDREAVKKNNHTAMWHIKAESSLTYLQFYPCWGLIEFHKCYLTCCSSSAPPSVTLPPVGYSMTPSDSV